MHTIVQLHHHTPISSSSNGGSGEKQRGMLHRTLAPGSGHSTQLWPALSPDTALPASARTAAHSSSRRRGVQSVARHLANAYPASAQDWDADQRYLNLPSTPYTPPTEHPLHHLPYTIHFSGGAAFNVRFLARPGSPSPHPLTAHLPLDHPPPHSSPVSSQSSPWSSANRTHDLVFPSSQPSAFAATHTSKPTSLPLTIHLASGVNFQVRLLASQGSDALCPIAPAQGTMQQGLMESTGPLSYTAARHRYLLPKPPRTANTGSNDTGGSSDGGSVPSHVSTQGVEHRRQHAGTLPPLPFHPILIVDGRQRVASRDVPSAPLVPCAPELALCSEQDSQQADEGQQTEQQGGCLESAVQGHERGKGREHGWREGGSAQEVEQLDDSSQRPQAAFQQQGGQGVEGEDTLKGSGKPQLGRRGWRPGGEHALPVTPVAPTLQDLIASLVTDKVGGLGRQAQGQHEGVGQLPHRGGHADWEGGMGWLGPEWVALLKAMRITQSCVDRRGGDGERSKSEAPVDGGKGGIEVDAPADDELSSGESADDRGSWMAYAAGPDSGCTAMLVGQPHNQQQQQQGEGQGNAKTVPAPDCAKTMPHNPNHGQAKMANSGPEGTKASIDSVNSNIAGPNIDSHSSRSTTPRQAHEHIQPSASTPQPSSSAPGVVVSQRRAAMVRHILAPSPAAFPNGGFSSPPASQHNSATPSQFLSVTASSAPTSASTRAPSYSTSTPDASPDPTLSHLSTQPLLLPERWARLEDDHNTSTSSAAPLATKTPDISAAGEYLLAALSHVHAVEGQQHMQQQNTQHSQGHQYESTREHRSQQWSRSQPQNGQRQLAWQRLLRLTRQTKKFLDNPAGSSGLTLKGFMEHSTLALMVAPHVHKLSWQQVVAVMTRYSVLTTLTSIRSHRLPPHLEQLFMSCLAARLTGTPLPQPPFQPPFQSTASHPLQRQQQVQQQQPHMQQQQQQPHTQQEQEQQYPLLGGPTVDSTTKANTNNYDAAPENAYSGSCSSPLSLSAPLWMLPPQAMCAVLRCCGVLGFKHPDLLMGLEQLVLRRVSACSPALFMQCLVSLAELGRGPLAPTSNPQPSVTSSSSPGPNHCDIPAYVSGAGQPWRAQRGGGPGFASTDAGGEGESGLLLGPREQSLHCSALLQRVLMERARHRWFLEAICDAALLRLLGCLAKSGKRSPAVIDALQGQFSFPRIKRFTADQLALALHYFSMMTYRPILSLASRLAYFIAQDTTSLRPESYVQIFGALAKWGVSVSPRRNQLQASRAGLQNLSVPQHQDREQPACHAQTQNDRQQHTQQQKHLLDVQEQKRQQLPQHFQHHGGPQHQGSQHNGHNQQQDAPQKPFQSSVCAQLFNKDWWAGLEQDQKQQEDQASIEHVLQEREQQQQEEERLQTQEQQAKAKQAHLDAQQQQRQQQHHHNRMALLQVLHDVGSPDDTAASLPHQRTQPPQPPSVGLIAPQRPPPSINAGDVARRGDTSNTLQMHSPASSHSQTSNGAAGSPELPSIPSMPPSFRDSPANSEQSNTVTGSHSSGQAAMHARTLVNDSSNIDSTNSSSGMDVRAQAAYRAQWLGEHVSRGSMDALEASLQARLKYFHEHKQLQQLQKNEQQQQQQQKHQQQQHQQKAWQRRQEAQPFLQNMAFSGQELCTLLRYMAQVPRLDPLPATLHSVCVCLSSQLLDCSPKDIKRAALALVGWQHQQKQLRQSLQQQSEVQGTWQQQSGSHHQKAWHARHGRQGPWHQPLKGKPGHTSFHRKAPTADRSTQDEQYSSKAFNLHSSERSFTAGSSTQSNTRDSCIVTPPPPPPLALDTTFHDCSCGPHDLLLMAIPHWERLMWPGNLPSHSQLPGTHVSPPHISPPRISPPHQHRLSSGTPSSHKRPTSLHHTSKQPHHNNGLGSEPSQLGRSKRPHQVSTRPRHTRALSAAQLLVMSYCFTRLWSTPSARVQSSEGSSTSGSSSRSSLTADTTPGGSKAGGATGRDDGPGSSTRTSSTHSNNSGKPISTAGNAAAPTTKWPQVKEQAVGLNDGPHGPIQAGKDSVPWHRFWAGVLQLQVIPRIQNPWDSNSRKEGSSSSSSGSNGNSSLLGRSFQGTCSDTSRCGLSASNSPNTQAFVSKHAQLTHGCGNDDGNDSEAMLMGAVVLQVYACARIGHRQEAFMRTACAWLRPRVKHLSPQQAVQLCFGLGLLCFKDDALLSELRVEALRGWLDAASGASSHDTNPPGVARAADDRARSFRPAFVYLVWAHARLGPNVSSHPEYHELVWSMCGRLKVWGSSSSSSANKQGTGAQVQAQAQAQQQQAHTRVVHREQGLMASLDPHELALFAWSLSASGCIPRGALPALGPALAACVARGDLKPKHILMVMWAYASARIRHDGLLASTHSLLSLALLPHLHTPPGSFEQHLHAGTMVAAHELADSHRPRLVSFSAAAAHAKGRGASALANAETVQPQACPMAGLPSFKDTAEQTEMHWDSEREAKLVRRRARAAAKRHAAATALARMLERTPEAAVLLGTCFGRLGYGLDPQLERALLFLARPRPYDERS